MVKLFRNTEIKYMIIKFCLIATAVFTIFILGYNTLARGINSVYIKQNTVLAGRILNNHPELETEIVSMYTKQGVTEYSEDDYNKGKEILGEYSYTENLEYQYNRAIGFELTTFKFNIGFLMFSAIIILFIFVLREFSMLYNRINKLALTAERINEGDFTKVEEEYNEGEFYLLISCFNDMIERLKASMEIINNEKQFLKNLIADITHQYKTPLASLIMFNELMLYEEDMPKEEAKDCLISSKEQLSRMEWLTLSMLKLAKLESGTIQFKKSNFNIKNTIYSVIDSLEFKIKEKDIKLNIDITGNLEFAYDDKWLQEALINILKNSIEHSEKYGEIDIEYWETSLSYNLNIKDNGEGIKKQELNKVFNRFYKGVNSVKGDSIGIGLSLSKLIIEGQNGVIKVDSEYGEWTCFKITFYKGTI